MTADNERYTWHVTSHPPCEAYLGLELMPSTVIRSFNYDADSRELSIVFQSGLRYTYENVPAETYTAMKSSFSKGEFFNAHIRDHFSFVRESTQK